MNNKYIKFVQDMLNKKNKLKLSENLKNAYYECEFLNDWNNHETALVNVFVNPDCFIELEDVSDDDKNLLIKFLNALPHEYDEIISIKFSININSNSSRKNRELVTVWEQNHFNLFITHLVKHKDKATNVKNALKIYGISGFVAHEDIKPSKEWQDEIEKALHSMDALTAILMDGVKKSDWCDQEIGFAVGKEVPIIPIRKGLDPYGFIGKYQAIQGNGKNVPEVAKAIFDTIVNHSKTKNNMLLILTNLISNSTHIETSLKQLEILCAIDNVPKEILIQMSEQIINNTILTKSKEFLEKVQILFDKYEIKLASIDTTDEIYTDEIPF